MSETESHVNAVQSEYSSEIHKKHLQALQDVHQTVKSLHGTMNDAPILDPPDRIQRAIRSIEEVLVESGHWSVLFICEHCGYDNHYSGCSPNSSISCPHCNSDLKKLAVKQQPRDKFED
jgi:hypothetical protein